MNMKWTEKLGYFFIFAVVITGVVLSHVDLEYYQGVYTREDGFVEWLTVFGLLAGASTCFYRAKVLAKFRSPWFVLGLVGMGCLFIFGAGEEISWGQRIFNWHIPEFFAKNNSQGETNLHNLVVGGTKINKLIFGLFLTICVVIYFLILPVLYRKVEKIKELVDKFAVPIPKNTHIIAYLTLFGLSQLIVGHKPGEILE
ncbi:hypothetical protein, partial [Bacteriovorax sp. DB6_IX]|uniref:hypothetical protein n=1 Tax=Bacteriovorax sp. DB6_IX TaxID=1353530 RepID=UPI00038A2BF4